MGCFLVLEPRLSLTEEDCSSGPTSGLYTSHNSKVCEFCTGSLPDTIPLVLISLSQCQQVSQSKPKRQHSPPHATTLGILTQRHRDPFLEAVLPGHILLPITYPLILFPPIHEEDLAMEKGAWNTGTGNLSFCIYQKNLMLYP